MKPRVTLETTRLHAMKLGGACLSKEYVNSRTKLEWQCQEGHIWLSTWNHTHAGRWCPTCANAKPARCDLEALATKRGGTLRSQEYINARQPLIWGCRAGHSWAASWDHVRRGHWCPVCAGRYSNEDLQLLAAAKGGVFLPQIRRSGSRWQCVKGHEWSAPPSRIKKGHWCPVCAGVAKPELLELQAHAAKQGGTLLSTEYTNSSTKLIWICAEGHPWRATWNNVGSKGSWCPVCTAFKTEARCRSLLESRLGVSLAKKSFKVGVQRLEWDGFNEEHKLAFEYQGYQHFEFPNYWHKTKEDHKAALMRDALKVKYSKEHGITLLVIPYTSEDDLEGYVDSLATLWTRRCGER